MKITIIATGFAEDSDETKGPKEHPAVIKANLEAKEQAEAAAAKDDEDLDMEDVMGLFRAKRR
jgi:hypothetical protein